MGPEYIVRRYPDMAHRKQGKFEKTPSKRGKKKKSSAGMIVMLCVEVILCCALGAWLIWGGFGSGGDGVFGEIVRDGYSGTQEQWLASLVGQEAGGRTAYQLACGNGYRESEAVWLETISGSRNTEAGMSPYAAACQNGYSGTFAQWLESLAEEPEAMGRSESGEEKTEYELACEYGYTGTFIEWLISVTNDQVF